MGFTCGIYKTKRFNNLSLDQIRVINDYYDYENNEWSKKNYKDWQSYVKGCGSQKDPSVVTQEDIDLYKDEYMQHSPDEYSPSLFKEYDTWCSDGHTFHEWFMHQGTKIDDYTVILDKSTVISALDYCSMMLQSMRFKPVVIQRAFTENEETEVIMSVPCDGVEIEDEEGNIQRQYTNDWEYTEIYVPENGYFEEEKYNAITRLLDCLICILVSTDFDNEIVFYSGGY